MYREISGIGCSSTFWSDARGTVAITFGMTVVPLALAGSVALDMANSSKIKSQLQAAADTAVLAAATRLAGNASESDKEEIALSTFYANLSLLRSGAHYLDPRSVG